MRLEEILVFHDEKLVLELKKVTGCFQTACCKVSRRVFFNDLYRDDKIYTFINIFGNSACKNLLEKIRKQTRSQSSHKNA